MVQGRSTRNTSGEHLYLVTTLIEVPTLGPHQEVSQLVTSSLPGLIEGRSYGRVGKARPPPEDYKHGTLHL